MPYDDVKAQQNVRENHPNKQIYYVFLLRKGPEWSPDETPEINALQEAHLANYRRLDEIGKLAVTGPFLDSFAIVGDLRGMGVLKAESMEEARELIGTDPMVKAGRLVAELHAWMLEKNTFA